MPVDRVLRPTKVRVVGSVAGDPSRSMSPSVQPSRLSVPSRRTCQSRKSGTQGWRQVVMATGLGGAPSSREKRAISDATCLRTDSFCLSRLAQPEASARAPVSNSLMAVAPLAS